MLKVNYEQAMVGNLIVSISGNAVNQLKTNDEKLSLTLDKMKARIPMNFSKINNVIHEFKSDTDYIEFWHEVDIWL